MLQEKQYQPEMHRVMQSHPHRRFQIANRKTDIFTLKLSKKTSNKINQENLWIPVSGLMGHVSLYNSSTLALTNGAFAWDRIPVFSNSFNSYSQFFIRLSLNFIWNGSESQIFRPRYLTLLVPKVTWFMVETSSLILHWFRNALLDFLSSKISFIKAGDLYCPAF